MMSAVRQSNYWDAYWRTGAAVRGAAVTGDAPGDKFDSYWRDFFSSLLRETAAPRVIDLACGAGAVIRRATQSFGPQAVCLGADYAFHAAASLASARRDGAGALFGVAASADLLPFHDRSFDVVVSQFGLEYAGLDAFREAGRILAPGGAGQLIVHYKGGGIERECAENASVLHAILEAHLFETAEQAFSGDASASQKLNAIFKSLTPLSGGAPAAAKMLLRRLLQDVARLMARRKAYEPDDALGWLTAMRHEISAYYARMRAMTQAALNAEDIGKARERLSESGAVTQVCEAVTIAGKTAPAAWRIVFNRAR